MAFTFGVLAMQGAFREHRWMLERIGETVLEVRLPADLERVDALVMPGGESTTIGKLLDRWALMEPLRARITNGMPVWSTCAGAILLAKGIVERGRLMEQPRLGVLDVDVERNAFGRQVDSFEADVPVRGLDTPFHAVFIRAPVFTRVGPGVEVLSEVQVPGHGRPEAVFVRSGRMFAASFHPELTDDTRLHALFAHAART